MVMVLNGETTKCGGEATADLLVDEVLVSKHCLVAPSLVCEVYVILGFDKAIKWSDDKQRWQRLMAVKGVCVCCVINGGKVEN